MESVRKRGPAARPVGRGRGGARPQQAAQKAKSHALIVESASRLFRERGFAGATVDEVMAAAGLTRGGFYAHFEDKVDLAAEALAVAFEGSIANLFGADMPREPRSWRERAAKRYLTEAHLDNTGGGCPLPALGGDVARAEPELRSATEKQLARVLAELEQRVGGDAAGARQRSIAFLATCVGAMTLARSVEDRAVAREILNACRRELTKDSE
ncbi:MAG: TetR family transcriptional regulator [Polyangiaceae bacterium]|jgi:TetR/AcrR family transcriptional repressor of nem operon|nr:TetR family transcriptional regulator [Polyangiaceae bacterium]MBK8942617.1 TetR family transcriptional regulator [Polyangiaceae bacterium]